MRVMIGDKMPIKHERPTLDHPLLEKVVTVSDPPRGPMTQSVTTTAKNPKTWKTMTMPSIKGNFRNRMVLKKIAIPSKTDREQAALPTLDAVARVAQCDHRFELLASGVCGSHQTSLPSKQSEPASNV